LCGPEHRGVIDLRTANMQWVVLHFLFIAQIERYEQIRWNEKIYRERERERERAKELFASFHFK